MIKVHEKFVKTSWRSCFFFIKAYFIKAFANNVLLPVSNYFGNIYDLNSLFALKNFGFRLGSVFFGNGLDKTLISLNNYFINYTVFEKSRSVFLVDVNLRQSLPILNAKLKDLVKAKDINVIVIGYFSNFNFSAKHLSTFRSN